MTFPQLLDQLESWSGRARFTDANSLTLVGEFQRVGLPIPLDFSYTAGIAAPERRPAPAVAELESCRCAERNRFTNASVVGLYFSRSLTSCRAVLLTRKIPLPPHHFRFLPDTLTGLTEGSNCNARFRPLVSGADARCLDQHVPEGGRGSQHRIAAREALAGQKVVAPATRLPHH